MLFLDDETGDYQRDDRFSAPTALIGAPKGLEYTLLDVNPRDLAIDMEFSGKRLLGYNGDQKVAGVTPSLSLSGTVGGSVALETELKSKARSIFHWLSLRSAKNRASGCTNPQRHDRFWNRFSQILANTTVLSSQRAPSACDRSGMAENTCAMADAATARSRGLLSSDLDLHLDRTSSEKYYSGSLSPAATTTRVVEEGEHAASRLFGTPNTGKSKERESPGKWYNGVSPRVDRETVLKGRQSRRHSLGLGMKTFKGNKRRAQEGALYDMEPETVGQRTSKRFWAWGQRNVVY
ncbi:hypothetical protein BDZ97DRAFT_1785779 [Flammula alnicola]|nr:hypothetical protein BDZ97DRAFT_1785779 [Flammula alnicola]